MKVIHSVYIEKKDCVNGLCNFLLFYQVISHSPANIPPADLFSKRKIRRSLPDVTNNITSNKIQKILTDTDKLSKEKALY